MPARVKKAEAGTANTTAVAELTFNGYAKHSKGKVFDADVLTSLYGKLTGVANATLADVNSALTSNGGKMTSVDVRAKNSGQDVLVTFGGMQWTVTYLFQEGSEIVLDLWLADSTDKITWTDGWHNNGSQTWAYPANMYGTSYIRAVTLNNGGFYTYGGPDGIQTSGRSDGYKYSISSESALKSTTATQDASHKYSKFTMDTVDGSLTDFILTPSQVSYQENESAKTLLSWANDCSNDGWGSITYPTSGYDYSGKDKYGAWNTDKLWLPSYAEVGTGNATNGIWKCSTNQKITATGSNNDTDGTWTRTAKHNTDPNGMAPHKIQKNGGYGVTHNAVWEEFVARPALHLSLTKADAAKAEKVTVPALDATTTANLTYDGNDHIIKFDSDYDGSYIKIVSAATALSNAKSTDSTTGEVTAVNAGEYTVKIGLKSDSYYWDETEAVNTAKGSDKEREFKFTIKPWELDVPVVAGGDSGKKQKYNGEAQTFTVNRFKDYSDSLPNNAVGVKNLASDITQGTGASINDFSVTDVKKYEVNFELTDKENFIWKGSTAATATTDRKVEFEIEKKPLNITFALPTGVTSWTTLNTNTKGDITYKIADSTPAVTGETPTFVLYYFKDMDDESDKTKVSGTSLPVSTIAAKGTGYYTVLVTLASDNSVNGNYVIESGKDRQVLRMNAGEASIDDIAFVYTDSTMAEGETPKPLPEAGADGLKYAYDTAAKKAVTYQILLNFDAIDYLEVLGNYSYTYADASTTVNKAGEVTVSVSIKVKDAAKDKNKLPATYAGTKFAYTQIDDWSATVTFKYKIGKATMTLTGADIPLQYKTSTAGWTAYDSTKPPQYCADIIDIRVNPDKSLWRDGITNITLSPATELSGTVVKTYNPVAAITVNDNYEPVSSVALSWEISPEVLALDWQDECVTINDIDFWIPKLNATAAQAANLTYEYYYADGADKDTKIANIEDLCTADRTTNPVNLYVKVIQTGGTNQFKLADDPVNDHKQPFTLGELKTLVNVTLNVPEIHYGDSKTLAGAVTLTNSLTGSALNESLYEINIYKGEDRTNLANNEALGSLADFNSENCDAGKYLIEIKLLPDGEGNIRYALDRSRLVAFEIFKKQIALPTLAEIPFSGEYVNLADYLGGSYAEFKDIITLGGDYAEIRNVSKDGYSATLTITDPNYMWAVPSAEPAKYELKYSVKSAADAEVLDDATAEIKWNVTPIILDASKMWNKGKEGATLNLPENITKLITAETLNIGYRYYDDAGNYIETPELKGGKSFRVEAVLGGIDAEQGNVLFTAADGSISGVSERVSYTVPQSGAAAVFGNAVSFFKKNWLWLVIALAVLLFLIILICIIKHRKKTKEERLAKKEAEREKKEEEKRRKEDEKRRKEEEREAAKQKQQAELELQKAKQEAELAKIKAQAGMAGAGAAAMGAMAMAQQPQQPQMQQQMPQQMPVQQPMMQQAPQYDRSEMAELRAELAELRAQQRVNNNYPQQMPMMQQQTPQASQINEERLRALEDKVARDAEERARRAEENALRAAEDRMRAAEERAIRAELGMGRNYMPQQSGGNSGQNGISMDVLGALVVSALKNMAAGAQLKNNSAPKELPPVTEESKPLSVSYPPDAVVTTTTTVDTTKNGAPKRSREDDLRTLDIDGFYDTFEENK